MSRYGFLAKLFPVPAFAALMLAGCSGGEEKKPEAKPAAEKKEKAKKGGKLEELAAATDGVLKGRIVIDGESPKIELITAMAKHNDAEKSCLAPDATETEKIVQTWILAPDKKGVANVVIKLLPPAGKKFKDIAPASKEVVMDQPHCAFVPHVVALVPGQTLLMKNSAKVAHNTKTSVDPTSGNENKSQTIPPDGFVTFDFNPQKNPISIACDFHPWMTGLVFVNDSPYVAVTDKDGNFEIKNVPTGVELTVVGFHENGEVEGAKDGQKKTFVAGANTLDLKVKAK
jgi:plastocyanin